MASMASTTIAAAHEDEETTVGLSDLLRSCVFFVCSTYEPPLKANIETLVKSMGAQVRDDLCSDVTHLLTRYQTTEEYQQAIAEQESRRIVVATVHWIEDCMLHRMVIPPIAATDPLTLPCALSSILHYPLRSKNGIQELKNLKISVSGFVERDRMDVRSLIVGSGAQFTQHLDRQNTHLIVNDSLLDGQLGRKYVKASEWGIPVVTRQWISECLMHWKRVPEEPYIFEQSSSANSSVTSPISSPTRRPSASVATPERKRRDLPEQAGETNGNSHQESSKRPRLENGHDRETQLLNVLNQHLDSTEFHFDETLRQCDDVPSDEAPSTIRHIYERTLACVERMFLKTVERIASPTKTSSPPRRHRSPQSLRVPGSV